MQIPRGTTRTKVMSHTVCVIIHAQYTPVTFMSNLHYFEWISHAIMRVLWCVCVCVRLAQKGSTISLFNFFILITCYKNFLNKKNKCGLKYLLNIMRYASLLRRNNNIIMIYQKFEVKKSSLFGKRDPPGSFSALTVLQMIVCLLKAKLLRCFCTLCVYTLSSERAQRSTLWGSEKESRKKM